MSIDPLFIRKITHISFKSVRLCSFFLREQFLCLVRTKQDHLRVRFVSYELHWVCEWNTCSCYRPYSTYICGLFLFLSGWKAFMYAISGLFNSVCGRPPVLCLEDISSTVLKSSWNFVILERTPGITWSKWAEYIPFNYHLSICGFFFSFFVLPQQLVELDKLQSV